MLGPLCHSYQRVTGVANSAYNDHDLEKVFSVFNLRGVGVWYTCIQ